MNYKSIMIFYQIFKEILFILIIFGINIREKIEFNKY